MEDYSGEYKPAVEPVSGPDKDAKLWATFCHLSAFAGLLGVPFGSILGPLVIWLIKKDEMPFVDENGKNAMNFQMSILIYMFAATPLLCLGPLVFLAWIPLGIIDIVFTIIATLKANNGEVATYPMSIKFIK